MRVLGLFRVLPAAAVALGLAMPLAFLRAQEQQDPDEALDPDLALARASRTWTVIERVGSERWDATWTVRSDGKTFDAHWKHQPGGDEGDLRAFAKIASLRGSSIIVERPGLGRYTGTLNAARTRIDGRMSWSGGTWEVHLEPGSLPALSTPSTTQPASPTHPTAPPASPVSLRGAKWEVVEAVGSERWTAEWTIRSDGRSFDAVWSHTPGNERGRLTNFARIQSISGNQIVVNRPGLGNYTGTISADRRSIHGKMSWAGGTWQVTLPTALPPSLH